MMNDYEDYNGEIYKLYENLKTAVALLN